MTGRFTRRNFSLQIASGLGLGGIAFAAPQASPARSDEISHTADAIHQNRTFMALPKRVYEALMDPKQFDQITHLIPSMQPATQAGSAPTQISPEVGGAFNLFGGHIIGRHVELVPNKRIVQAWRVVDWDPGVYSIAKFELKQLASGTKLVFDHTGFPVGLAKHLADGWNEHYWEPLHRYLA
jgi:activator of HSP90 ATPase